MRVSLVEDDVSSSGCSNVGSMSMDAVVSGTAVSGACERPALSWAPGEVVD